MSLPMPLPLPLPLPQPPTPYLPHHTATAVAAAVASTSCGSPAVLPPPWSHRGPHRPLPLAEAPQVITSWLGFHLIGGSSEEVGARRGAWGWGGGG